MKTITRFLLVFLYFSFNVFSQNKPIDSLVQELEEDSILFEKVFIHTNKTTYNSEDAIWFKVYVAKNDNTPSLKTALVYVSLFSKQGELINTKNVYIKDGVGNNQFELNGDLISGEYIIQAYTNNMLNFGEDNKFASRITIGKNSNVITDSKALYDIQLFPEGGYFLEDVKNVVGIKALLNGKACNYKGKIVNSKNEKVALFSNRHLGMTKAQFIYKENENYKAIIELNDTIINKILPIAKKEGVLISKKRNDKDVIKFELKTNGNSNSDNFVLLFHQNNKIIDYVAVDFLKTRKKIFAFNEKDFLKGVNTVTVLKNNQPILERKFFVEGKINNELQIQKINKIEDSIIYKLKVKDLTSKSNLSLSVLSSNSNYSSNTDIASAMYLSPYVKGFIEHPSFYFNKDNANREAYLDLLLLTQGWTQFSQEDFIEKLNPKQVHYFENGFTLKGKLSPVLSNNLGVFTTDNQLIAKQFLNNQTTFSFNNLVAYKGDSIKLAFIEKEVIKRKPKKIKYDSIPIKKHNLSFLFYNKYLNESQKSGVKKVTNAITVSSYKKQDGVYSLGIVDIETKKKSQAFLDRKAFDKKHRKEVFDIGAYYELDIPEKFKDTNLTIQDYLFKDRGYWLYDVGIDGYKYVVKGFKFHGRSGIKIPLVIVLAIDGVDATTYGRGMPLDVALSIEMKYIKDIMYKPVESKYIDKIVFFTTDDYKKGTTNNFKTYVFKEGYSVSKKYYKPLFSQDSEITNNEIDWKPNLITNKKGEAVFKIKGNLDIENLFFSIQGLSEKGELISGFYTLDNSKAK